MISNSFVSTTVQRECLQFWAFWVLRWDLWDPEEVPTVPSASFAAANGARKAASAGTLDQEFQVQVQEIILFNSLKIKYMDFDVKKIEIN